MLKGLQQAGGDVKTRRHTASSCQILIPTMSVNSVHMLNTEGQELPCIKEASDVESQKLLILNGII